MIDIKEGENVTPIVPITIGPRQKNYFTIKEMCASDTAKRMRINNVPTTEHKKNLERLIAFMNPLREAWGSPILITSGYRSEQLNKIVKGSITSAHMRGNACDFVPKNGEINRFKKFCVEYLKDKDFDQLLLETSTTSEWVHLGLYNNAGLQRKQVKNMLT